MLRPGVNFQIFATDDGVMGVAFVVLLPMLDEILAQSALASSVELLEGALGRAKVGAEKFDGIFRAHGEVGDGFLFRRFDFHTWAKTFSNDGIVTPEDRRLKAGGGGT